MNKDRALFWIKRRIRELEDTGTVPDQKAMAARGLSYAERLATGAAASIRADKSSAELESLNEVVALIEAQP
jgi:hypothetical protein